MKCNRGLTDEWQNGLQTEWIIEKESCFENLLNCVSFLHPYLSQFLLANYSFMDLVCNTNSLEHPLITKDIFVQLDEIFSFKF